eukprot:gene10491-11622_t
MMQEVPEAKIIKNQKSSSRWQLRDFDLYQKVDENYRVQTSTGAALSLLGWTLIAFLAIIEMRNYFTPVVREHLAVDNNSLGQQLRIDINITFHALTCNEVHVDVMDIAGDNQLNVEHEMMKQRLTPYGHRIGNAGMEVIGEGPLSDIHTKAPVEDCGSCYGAESDIFKCCNTCNELIAAYQAKQWNVNTIIRNSTQCQRDRAQTFNGAQEGEGCNIWGTMRVNKVAGNFHIAHGESIVRDGRHVHHFNPALAPKFNISHTIHYLSFGEPYPNMPVNPLDKVSHIIPETSSTGLKQYFLRVIPTVYQDRSLLGPVSLETNQYTASDRFRPLAMPRADVPERAEAILPGIFFVYELSPFMIQAEKQQASILHLITKLCAIVGGIFTVLGVVDAIIFRVLRLLNKNK